MLTTLLFGVLALYAWHVCLGTLAFNSALSKLAEQLNVPPMPLRLRIPYILLHVTRPAFVYRETRRSVALGVIELLEERRTAKVQANSGPTSTPRESDLMAQLAMAQALGQDSARPVS